MATDLEGAVERAESILKAWNRRETDLLEANNRYLERARAAEVERDAMREGLKPFATIGHEAERSGFTQRDHEGAWGFNCINVTWGDFRRAAALVNGEASDAS